ncbi:MAG: prepilin-type N-terminal cleavage/methylation domain-containing protein [Clostridium sp.]|uniref:prepilin-type N-terminal cleavage/methylation domain-containing protein n=1 Tax=Clostridium sp. TaxID=1506 RepID=UPI00290C1C66|nr:prepilin-type N-terminal cleavage/methylation domain-containing protein [Clostridium sp.]MDU5110918.1 prepilin-type N-terminal cleavage/methylation domain-containing protein [Clostridium sp.]
MKKGYTLIEVIIVLSIMLLLSSLASLGYKFYKNSVEKIKLESTALEVRDLLSFSKAYCRKNEITGNLSVELDRKSISFTVDNNKAPIKKVIKLEDGLEIGSNFSGNNKVSEEGFITKAGTINIRSAYLNKSLELKVSVGNDIIRVSDKNEGDIID